MKQGNQRKGKVLAILLAAACCVAACAAAAVYQAGCGFRIGTPTLRATAGQAARLALYQSDCLAGILGHACFLAPEVTVKGLPAQCTVAGVEWVSCHASDLVIHCEPTTPPGVYPLKIRQRDSLSFGQRATLEVTAP